MTKILIDEATVKLVLEALEAIIVDVKTTPTAYEAQRQAIAALKALAEDVPETNFGNMAEQPAPVQYKSTGWAAHRDQYAVPVLFNPYTGEPRDVRDVLSDPQGILIVPPGKVEMRAAKQTHHTEQHLELVAEQPAQQEPLGYFKAEPLTVCIRSYPESNGKRNWTADFVRVRPFKGLIGSAGGVTIDHGECWNRVAYNAERARFLLGERTTEPPIREYVKDVATPEEWGGNDPEAAHNIKENT